MLFAVGDFPGARFPGYGRLRLDRELSRIDSADEMRTGGDAHAGIRGDKFSEIKSVGPHIDSFPGNVPQNFARVSTDNGEPVPVAKANASGHADRNRPSGQVKNYFSIGFRVKVLERVGPEEKRILDFAAA